MLPACVLWSVSDGEEIDDPGGEVQSHVCFTMNHRDTVSVPIAGSGHTTAEEKERRPTHTNKGSSSVQFALRLMCNNRSSNTSGKLS